MIRRHSKNIVPPKRPPSALAIALQEAIEKSVTRDSALKQPEKTR